MPVSKIRNTKNYFISSEGFVFRVDNGKEIICPGYYQDFSRDVFVKIAGKPKNLLYLMMECFEVKYTQTESLKFHVTQDLKIPLNSIRTDNLDIDITEEISKSIRFYNCDLKAASANQRCKEKVTPLHVYTCLSINSFRCIYCRYNIEAKNWHLDHYYPVSKGGKNVLENLVPSCQVCNIMKGAMTGAQFFKACKKVVDNFVHKELLHIE